MKNVFKKVAIAAAIAGAGFAASAAPVVGSANLSFGLVSISNGEVDWNPPMNLGFDAVATFGSFVSSGGANTGSFAAGPFAGLTNGLIHDMSNNGGLLPPGANANFPGGYVGPADGNYVPVGAGTTVDFLSFSAQPNWQFTSNFLVPGTQVAPGVFLPFTLTQVGQNVSATISLNGTVCDAGATGVATVCDLTDDVTKWTGIFSAQYNNTTVAGLIGFVGGGGVLANNTWSGTIEASKIPEPGSLALLGLGLVGLAASRRRSVK